MIPTPVFATLCLALAVIPVARSAVIDVTVGGTGVLAYTPNFVTANVGDIVQFTFKQKNHTITQSTLASPCTPMEGGFDSGFVPVAADATAFPLAQLTVKDLSPIWIFCRQAGHCAQGMVFAVNPGNKMAAFQAAATGNSPTSASSTAGAASASSSPSATASSAPSASSGVPTSIDHSIIVGGPNGNFYTPANITAAPGDTVTFHFHEKNHTVTASSFNDPCRPLSLTSTTGQLGFDSGFMPVSPNAAQFPSFTIQINNTQPLWAYCRQLNHCGSGMVFSVNAVENGPNNFAAFKAKAMQLNGTVTPGAGTGSTSTTDTPSAASALPVRSAAVMVTLAGLVAGMLL
ncbi:hypothetical protein B0H15DRAFT_838101 [Mycena belliarum]|uniref:Cupredoxin n=1 Tax=Mycena belliarum TaxID=1033014 RepID=A0AAD6UA69_9AGAR|nr:hypothetical protein B0H15DRAFT_838101 [Mycena belliae]